MKAYDHISSIISFFMYSNMFLMSFDTFLMVWDTLWQKVQTHSSKGMYDDVPESSTRRRGTFSLPAPPPSPLTPPVSLEQLLAPLNPIVQRLAAIGEWQAIQVQLHQQPQESSYFNFLVTQPPEFAETTDPLEANHWLQVTESKFGLLHCSKFKKTSFAVQHVTPAFYNNKILSN
jgi:hypothetical protein